jgi:hypothetical protein
MAVKIREKTGDGAETRVLRDEAFLPHISTRKINCDVLALLERAIALQHPRPTPPSQKAFPTHDSGDWGQPHHSRGGCP